MKKILLLALLSLVLLLAVACGDDDETPSGDSESAKTYNLTYGHAAPAGNPQGWGSSVGIWAQRVNDRTNGRVTVEEHAGGTLATVTNLPDVVGVGIADSGQAMVSLQPSLFPSFEISGLHEPVFGTKLDEPSNVMASRILYEEFPSLIKDVEEENLYFMFFISTGKHALVTRKPFSSLDDFNGMKIRTYGTFLPKLMEAVDAVPVGLPAPEVPEALDRGIVDGWYSIAGDTTINVGWHRFGIDKGGYTEVGSIPIFGAGIGFAMNMDLWRGLPNDIKRIMLEEAKKIEVEYGFAQKGERERGKDRFVDEFGFTFHKMSDADKQAWSTAAGDLLGEVAASMDGQGFPGTKLVARYRELTELSSADLQREFDAAWDIEIARWVK